MNNYLSPAELLASYSAAGVRKMERSAASLLLLGALAGAIIAIAAAATNTAVYGISDTWTVRTICGLLFPFGLGLVVVTGAERPGPGERHRRHHHRLHGRPAHQE